VEDGPPCVAGETGKEKKSNYKSLKLVSHSFKAEKVSVGRLSNL